MMEKTEIAQLVEKVRKGDNKAFEKLYNETNKGAYFVALKITGNEDDAMDILQDSYVKALDKLDQLKNDETFVSWFNQIVANTAKNYLCKMKPVLFNTEEEEQASQDWQTEEDSSFIPEESLDTNESRKAIMDIIDGLPEDRRLCVLMYYFDDMGTSQIARTLEIPEGTVKSHLLHARKSIKKTIEELRLKGATVLGTTAIPFFAWLLKRMSATVVMSSEQAGSLLMLIKGASVLLGGVAVAGGTAAVIGGTVVKVGIFSKIVAAITVPKIVAFIVGGAIIIGGVSVGITITRRGDKKKEESTLSSGTYYYHDNNNNETYSFVDAIVIPGENISESPTHGNGGEIVSVDPEGKTIVVPPVTDSDVIVVSGVTSAGISKPAPQTVTVKNEPASAAKTTVRSTVITNQTTSVKHTQTTKRNENNTTESIATTRKRTTTTRIRTSTTRKVITSVTRAERSTVKPTTTRVYTTREYTTQKPTTTKAVTTTQPTTKATTVPTTVTTTAREDFEYTVSGSSATITGYKGSGGSVNIPSTLGGATVTAIASYAFEDAAITSVSVPSTVVSIGNGAFSNCTGLTSVTLPSGLSSMGTAVFKGCTKLSQVNIPSSLSSIPSGTFQGCSKLTSITIPSSVTSIGSKAFEGCTNLTINCTSGSAAESYAIANGINYSV